MNEDIRNVPFIIIEERWSRTSSERRIGNGPWEPIDLSVYGGQVPITFMPEPVQNTYTTLVPFTLCCVNCKNPHQTSREMANCLLGLPDE